MNENPVGLDLFNDIDVIVSSVDPFVHTGQIVFRYRFKSNKNGCATGIPHQFKKVVLLGDVYRSLTHPVDIVGLQAKKLTRELLVGTILSSAKNMELFFLYWT
jgi:hypothetical protein